MSIKKRFGIGIIMILGATLACALWLVCAPPRAGTASPESNGVSTTAVTKPPGTPYWADSVTDWTLNSGIGRVGVYKATGGQVAHGWCYAFHLGPFGTCTFQGPKVGFARGQHTRGAVISLAAILVGASVVVIAYRAFRYSKETRQNVA